MGRPRKSQSSLPPCYRESHGAYYHIKGGVWRRVGTSIADVAADYQARITAGVPAERQLDPLIDGALARMEVAPSTKYMYSRAAVKLKHHLRAFSRPDQVKQKDAAAVKVRLAKTPILGNLVLTVGRLVWNDFLEHQLIEQNPFIGVKRYPTAARTRSYTWEEWNLIRSHAKPLLQLVMDGLFLTDQRIGDVLKIDERDLLEAGIYVKQQKTGKELIIAWNDDLRAWVEACRAARGNVVRVEFEAPDRPRPLLRRKNGRGVKYDAIAAQWRKACGAAGVEDAHMHDGRAFSAGEAKRQGHDPQKLLGHNEASTTKIYLRDREVEVVRGPSMRRLIGGAA